MKNTYGRFYRVNPFCPNCGEEHAYYWIEISEDEQQTLDSYYTENQNKSTLALLLAGAPLVVTRSFKCPVCDTCFEKAVGIHNVNRYDYRNNEILPSGNTPV